MLKSLFASRSPERARAPAPAAGSEYFDYLMERFFVHIGQTQTGNFDYERHGVAPGTPVGVDMEMCYRWYQTMRERIGDLERARNLLEDEASGQLYDDLLLYRMLLHPHVRLPSNNPAHWAAREQARGYRVDDSVESPLKLRHYRIDFLGETLDLRCWDGSIAWTFLLRQYFFDRGGARVQVEPGDIVIDAGALVGDTALAFAAAAGRDGRVYAFDIMPAHVEAMRANLAANSAGSRVKAFEAALADSGAESLYIHGDGPGAHVSAEPSDRPVTVTSIDEFVADHKLPRVDFIKMDIEGAEGSALRGAERTIKRYRPRLAISLYHRPTDICDLPLLIDSMGAGYAYYLDHYTIHTEETVLYAIPRA